MEPNTFIVGAYATSPNLYGAEHPDEGIAYDAEQEARFYSGLAAVPAVGGLEVQFDGKMHADEALFLSELARPQWRGVLTCIGGTMARIGADPAFGLASTDEAGRAAALEFAREACDAVARWNARPGAAAAGGRMVAVEIHSAPNTTKAPSGSSAEAFGRSLTELSRWDWHGAQLVVEHCDAATPANTAPSKGFLPLDQEIEAVQQAGADAGIGVAVNWARSTIEARDGGATAATHIDRAARSGLLRAVMFSGCTGVAGPYGPWRDCHMPHAPTDGVEYAVDGSLMDAAAMRASAAARGDAALLYTGCKITSLNSGRWVGADPDDVDTRVGLNRDCVAQVAAAMQIQQ